MYMYTHATYTVQLKRLKKLHTIHKIILETQVRSHLSHRMCSSLPRTAFRVLKSKSKESSSVVSLVLPAVSQELERVDCAGSDGGSASGGSGWCGKCGKFGKIGKRD